MTAVSASGTSTTELVYKRLPLIEKSLMRPSLMFLFIPRSVSSLLQEQMVWQKFLSKLSLLYKTYLWLLNHDSYCTILCTIISFRFFFIEKEKSSPDRHTLPTFRGNCCVFHPHPSYVVISILCLIQSFTSVWGSFFFLHQTSFRFLASQTHFFFSLLFIDTRMANNTSS